MPHVSHTLITWQTTSNNETIPQNNNEYCNYEGMHGSIGTYKSPHSSHVTQIIQLSWPHK